jgi:glycosyltransferase involved in cell wall biosynthesis
MRILVSEPTGCGKLSQYTYGLCNALADEGNDVTLATSKNYEQEELDRAFRVVKVFRNFLSYSRFLRVFGAVKPEVVHFQGIYSAFFDCLLLKTLKRHSRIVYTPHNVLPHEMRFHHPFFYKRMYCTADRIIAHSNFSKMAMMDFFGVDPTKIAVIPEGYCIQAEDYPGLTRERAREEIGLPREAKVVLFFGYIRRHKGLKYLLRAFSMVKESLEDARLVIAGCPTGDFRYYGDMISRLRIDNEVITDLRYIPRVDVVKYFASSDIVVLPYLRTVHSPIIPTAYSFGKPVITTMNQIGIVEDGKSGFLVPPRDETRLAGAIIKAFSRRKLLSEMSDYVRGLARTNFSWRSIAKKTLEVYENRVN